MLEWPYVSSTIIQLDKSIPRVSEADLTIDDFGPIAMLGNTLYSNAAVFDVIGDVSVLTPSNRRRDPHHEHEHHGYDFHGHGGCLVHSSHHGGSFAGPASGHPTSHSPQSSFHNPGDGYCYSANIMFGPDHDHHHPHYLFTTHGDHHHEPGASLCYHNGKLDFHEHHHEPHHEHHHGPHPGEHHDHHHHVSVPFNPIYGVSYDIAVSYS